MPFDKRWFKRNQRHLLLLLNTPILGLYVRSIFRINTSHTIYEIGTSYYIQKLSHNTLRADFRTHPKYQKRIYCGFKHIWLLSHFWDIYFANRFAPAWNLGFDTLTEYPDPHPETDTVDGRLAQWESAGDSWANLCQAAGNQFSSDNATNSACLIEAHATTDLWATCSRGIWLFDTSALTAAAIIDSAVLSIYGENKVDTEGWAPTLNIYSTNPNSNNDLIAADFATYGTIPFSDTAMTYAAFTVGAYNNFTLNTAGLAAIVKTGISKFGGRSNYDITETTPAWAAGEPLCQFGIYSADRTGTNQDPRLVVDYSLKTAPLPLFFRQ